MKNVRFEFSRKDYADGDYEITLVCINDTNGTIYETDFGSDQIEAIANKYGFTSDDDIQAVIIARFALYGIAGLDIGDLL